MRGFLHEAKLIIGPESLRTIGAKVTDAALPRNKPLQQKSLEKWGVLAGAVGRPYEPAQPLSNDASISTFLRYKNNHRDPGPLRGITPRTVPLAPTGCSVLRMTCRCGGCGL